jgi:hypothetical protein
MSRQWPPKPLGIVEHLGRLDHILHILGGVIEKNFVIFVVVGVFYLVTQGGVVGVADLLGVHIRGVGVADHCTEPIIRGRDRKKMYGGDVYVFVREVVETL